MKEAAPSESQAASTEGSSSEVTNSAGKAVAKPVFLPSVSAEPIRMPIKAASNPAPFVIEPETPAAGVGKATAQTSLHPDLNPPSAETLLAKTSEPVQAAAPHAPDGSSLAALSTLPRTVETAAAAAPAAPPAPVATPPTAPVLQVEGGLRWMLKGGAQEAQLQLHPDSLGQVTIHLKVEGGEVHARLWITEPGSVQAVQEGRPHLEMCLKEQGLQLGSFDLHQGRRPFQEGSSASPYPETAVPETVSARQEAPSIILPSILNPHRVELYA
jgi:flagellar hook-length control protein FliK